MNPTTSGWRTSEFWAHLAGVASSFVIVLVMLGVIPAASQEGVTDAIVRLIVAIGGIVGISTGTLSYGKHRAELKRAAMVEQTKRMLASRPQFQAAQRQHIAPLQPGVRR